MNKKFKVYRCGVPNCAEPDFTRLDDMIQHLKDNHPHLLSYNSPEELILEVIEELDADTEEMLHRYDLPDQEESSPAGPRNRYTPGTEFSDKPDEILPDFKGEPREFSKPKQYSYHQVRGYTYEGEAGKEKTFHCKCGLTTKDFALLWKHMKAKHPEDVDKWLDESVTNKMTEEFTLRSKTEPIHPDQFQKWKAERKATILANLTTLEVHESEVMNTSTVRQLGCWLVGACGICPTCNLTYDSAMISTEGVPHTRSVSDTREKQLMSKVLDLAKRDIPNYKNLKFDDFKHVKLAGTWGTEDCKFDLMALSHTAFNHTRMFEMLRDEHVISGQLVDLMSELLKPQQKLETRTHLSDSVVPVLEDLRKEIKEHVTEGTPSEQSGVEILQKRDDHRREKSGNQETDRTDEYIKENLTGNRE